MSLFETQPSFNELMKAEVSEIAERRGPPGNMHECYARMADAAEKAESATKEWKELIKRIWQTCKDADTDAYDAYVNQLADVALMSSMMWLTVAAEAGRTLGRGDE